jgi:hypothetical protein
VPGNFLVVDTRRRIHAYNRISLQSDLRTDSECCYWNRGWKPHSDIHACNTGERMAPGLLSLACIGLPYSLHVKGRVASYCTNYDVTRGALTEQHSQ